MAQVQAGLRQVLAFSVLRRREAAPPCAGTTTRGGPTNGDRSAIRWPSLATPRPAGRPPLTACLSAGMPAATKDSVSDCEAGRRAPGSPAPPYEARSSRSEFTENAGARARHRLDHARHPLTRRPGDAGRGSGADRGAGVRGGVSASGRVPQKSPPNPVVAARRLSDVSWATPRLGRGSGELNPGGGVVRKYRRSRH